MTEEEILRLLRQKLIPQHREVICGVGDDCAVLESDSFWELITTDTMVEGVHFDFAYFSPYELGRKLAVVNLSDIAAMGGEPFCALLNLSLPRAVRPEIESFFQGLKERLAEFGAELIGGDITRNKCGWHLSLTIMGKAPKGGVVFRKGAKEGDLLYVSRALGGAAAALELFQKGIEPPPSLKKAHVDPDPEIELGKMLARNGLASAMMDISDGLLLDLARLCEANNLGAELYASKIPVFQELENLPLEKDPLHYALSGGEDFALLFSVPPQREKLLNICKRTLFCIGRLISEKGLFLIGEKERKEVSPQGFDHFA
ncbi:thiamine-phosphate kinase [Thermodesulfatator atlanticus]|uniref:thiamine-phosphate kinase n=1 Tax=Thermodesulfatator atlanticus TaxID=501497 RepID=UPI0003B521AE|nr:thiamine-phosphate kinase [Thermodesulfatator atlanticus]